MNNLRHEDLLNVHVIVKERCVTGTTDNPLTRLFLCTGGNGLRNSNMGSSIFGKFLANPTMGKELTRIDGMSLERLATPKEILLAQN